MTLTKLCFVTGDVGRCGTWMSHISHIILTVRGERPRVFESYRPHPSPPFVRPAFSGPFCGESFDVPEVHGKSAHPPEAKIS